jgi:hypothetical protein
MAALYNPSFVYHQAHQIFLSRMITIVKRGTRGSPAARLWAAAYPRVDDPLKSLFDEVARDYPAKVRSPKHWTVFVRRLEREAEEASHIIRTGEPSGFIKSRKSVEIFSDRNGYTMEGGFETWSYQGSALRDAIEQLKIPLAFVPPLRKSAPLGVCRVCWRTGFPSRRGQFFCHEHATLGTSYKRAWERSHWRSADQAYDPTESFVEHWVRKLKKEIPSAYLAWESDFAPLTRICFGREDGIDDTAEWGSELADYWHHFPCLHKYVRRMRPRLDVGNPIAVLGTMDPIGSRQPVLHHLLHRSMSIDHRLLYDRFAYAEACLETDSRRTKNRGLGAWRFTQYTNVVPYEYATWLDKSVLRY